MSDGRVAKRYAKPLLELAQEQGVLEETKKDMELFVGLCEDSKDLQLMLKSPIIPHLKKLSILEKLFKGKVGNLTYSIFEIIVKKNRESILFEVGKSFLSLYNKAKGLIEATVTSTIKLDDKTKKEFEKLVKSVTGQDAILTEVVDPSVIGGFKLKIGDQQIDETVSSKLRELELKFLNA